ncbi:glycosyltransferase family 4 protein [Helicobacter cappadocius]|uniref:Glycosyltransferase family 1 protein n=1 Tax=Helicobacter cappadocius TaxID=3063998 RepID=A0AA90PKE5_9HELI|nr:MULTISPECIES: glycosyltransferase family 1 protein [unclassified Helicobacter]MDO7253206.1 glycosyltransferase family 1 protein [Helicobacter sp. faydin-H75]MDP2539130.1 glycosyltransferase family 1 protein [Helicobacter sp. faydin-H76]
MMKIIFDGRVLGNIQNKNMTRTGIFFSAYNLFLEMSRNKDIEVLLYSDVKAFYAIKKYSQYDENFRDIKNVFKYSKLTQWVSYGFWLRMRFLPKNIIEIFFAKLFTLVLLILKRMFCIFDKSNLSKNEQYVFFSPMEKIPSFFHNNDKVIKFTLLHDVIPILGQKHYTLKKNDWFCELFDSINPNDYYFANSVYTRKDFIKYCSSIDANKITVTYLGANENFYPNKDEKKNRLIKEKYHIPQDQQYIFSLCSIEPRKNLLFAVENFIRFVQTYQINDVVFVLSGAHWKEFIKTLQDKIQDLGEYGNKIIRAGYVDDKDLANLYSHSLCSVYLSTYEGFGLPALEAMSCGTPLIASNATSIPEVVGDGGVLISPSDDLALQDAFKKIYFDSAFAKELSLKGIKQAKKFSWKKCATQMIEKMKAVLEQKNLDSKCL